MTQTDGNRRTVPGAELFFGESVAQYLADLSDDVFSEEGYAEGRWIVLDFGYVLLHIFYPEEREYYNIERLWTDGAAEVVRFPEKE